MNALRSGRRWVVGSPFGSGRMISTKDALTADEAAAHKQWAHAGNESSVWHELSLDVRHGILNAIGLHSSHHDNGHEGLSAFRRAIERGDLVVLHTAKASSSRRTGNLKPGQRLPDAPTAQPTLRSPERKPERKRPHSTGHVSVSGQFRDEPDAPAPPGRERNGKDAITEFLVSSALTWKSLFDGDDAFMNVSFIFKPETLTTYYFGKANRTSLHDRHETLGAHEDLHKALAQSWWTTANISAIAAREHFKMEYVFPKSLDDAAINEALESQLHAIHEFLVALHLKHQKETLDKEPVPPPTFSGERQ